MPSLKKLSDVLSMVRCSSPVFNCRGSDSLVSLYTLEETPFKAIRLAVAIAITPNSSNPVLANSFVLIFTQASLLQRTVRFFKPAVLRATLE
jgi:hypothetical protein